MYNIPPVLTLLFCCFAAESQACFPSAYPSINKPKSKVWRSNRVAPLAKPIPPFPLLIQVAPAIQGPKPQIAPGLPVLKLPQIQYYPSVAYAHPIAQPLDEQPTDYEITQQQRKNFFNFIVPKQTIKFAILNLKKEARDKGFIENELNFLKMQSAAVKKNMNRKKPGSDYQTFTNEYRNVAIKNDDGQYHLVKKDPKNGYYVKSTF